MASHAIDALSSFLKRENWASELASILPLSALIDFIEIPPKLHILELVGAVPLWSWAVTPAGSRLLLSKQTSSGSTAASASHDCYQDRFGKTVALQVLDGRYGERYIAASPETLRLVIESSPLVEVENDHTNMTDPTFEHRVNNLEVVYISRDDSHPSSPRHARAIRRLNPFHQASWLYLLTTAAGWMLLVGMIVMSAILQTWLSLAFLALIPTTGAAIFYLHGGPPRRLLVQDRSDFVRLLVVSEHYNTADWRVIYGESTVVNSLLNRPLKKEGVQLPPLTTAALRLVLRACIVGQWALAIGAAATKDWDAYFITAWIGFSIFSHAYLVPPASGARDWFRFQAGLRMRRFSTPLSSRRALINTIAALNPDTFAVDRSTGVRDASRFYAEGMRWIDPILAPSDNRTLWEEATRKAMAEAPEHLAGDDAAFKRFRGLPFDCLSPAWNDEFKDRGRCYWAKMIPEGIYMAAKLKRVGGLPDRQVLTPINGLTGSTIVSDAAAKQT